MTQGLPPLRDRNEVCVSSEGTWAILSQSLRCKDSMPKVGDLSLPLIPTFFSENGRTSCCHGRPVTALVGWLQPLTLSEPLSSSYVRFCMVQWAVIDMETCFFQTSICSLYPSLAPQLSFGNYTSPASIPNSSRGLAPCYIQLEDGFNIHV